MYNQLFTDTWKMDRCIEASWFANTFLNLYALAALIAILLFCGFRYYQPSLDWLVMLKKRLGVSVVVLSNVMFLGLSIIGGLVLALPAMALVQVLAIIVGFLLLNCSFGPLWDRIRPAHELHAVLKRTREIGGQTPRSLEEFKQLRPEPFAKIEGRAEFTYEYIPERDGFHFTVRPSKYVIADFSDQDDYVLYRTDSLISPHIFRGNPQVGEKK